MLRPAAAAAWLLRNGAERRSDRRTDRQTDRQDDGHDGHGPIQVRPLFGGCIMSCNVELPDIKTCLGAFRCHICLGRSGSPRHRGCHAILSVCLAASQIWEPMASWCRASTTETTWSGRSRPASTPQPASAQFSTHSGTALSRMRAVAPALTLRKAGIGCMQGVYQVPDALTKSEMKINVAGDSGVSSQSPHQSWRESHTAARPGFLGLSVPFACRATNRTGLAPYLRNANKEIVVAIQVGHGDRLECNTGRQGPSVPVSQVTDRSQRPLHSSAHHVGW
jgi:hypothetical protein